MYILATEEALYNEANELGKKLNVPVVCRVDSTNLEENIEFGPFLRLDTQGLTLTDNKNEMRGDFTKMLRRLKQNNLSKEMLVKTAKIKGADHPLTVLDATAGMGEDSLLLAAAGFKVKLYEYDPIIAALLADTLKRAKQIPELEKIVERMELFNENSIEAMKKIGEKPNQEVINSEKPDVILLDPMFPERQKSALVKKKFQLLQQLESPCSDEEDMLQAAIIAHPKKIVIKRPLKGPFLAGKKPSYSISGKAIRYDCIVLA